MSVRGLGCEAVSTAARRSPRGPCHWSPLGEDAQGRRADVEVGVPEGLQGLDKRRTGRDGGLSTTEPSARCPRRRAAWRRGRVPGRPRAAASRRSRRSPRSRRSSPGSLLLPAHSGMGLSDHRRPRRGRRSWQPSSGMRAARAQASLPAVECPRRARGRCPRRRGGVARPRPRRRARDPLWAWSVGHARAGSGRARGTGRASAGRAPQRCGRSIAVRLAGAGVSVAAPVQVVEADAVRMTNWSEGMSMRPEHR